MGSKIGDFGFLSMIVLVFLSLVLVNYLFASPPPIKVVTWAPTHQGTGIGTLDSMKAAGITSVIWGRYAPTSPPIPELSTLNQYGMNNWIEATSFGPLAPYAYAEFFQFQCDSLWNRSVRIGNPIGINCYFSTFGIFDKNNNVYTDPGDSLSPKPRNNECLGQTGYFDHEILVDISTRDNTQIAYETGIRRPNASNGYSLRVTGSDPGYAVWKLWTWGNITKMFCSWGREQQVTEFIMRLHMMAKDSIAADTLAHLRMEVWLDMTDKNGSNAQKIAERELMYADINLAYHQYHDYDLPFSLADPTKYRKALDYQYLDFRVFYCGRNDVVYLDNIEVMDTLFRDEMRDSVSPGVLAAAQSMIDLIRQDTSGFPEDPPVRLIWNSIGPANLAAVGLLHQAVNRILLAEGCGYDVLPRYHVSFTQLADTNSWFQRALYYDLHMEPTYDPILGYQGVARLYAENGRTLTPEEFFREHPNPANMPMLVYLNPDDWAPEHDSLCIWPLDCLQAIPMIDLKAAER